MGTVIETFLIHRVGEMSGDFLAKKEAEIDTQMQLGNEIIPRAQFAVIKRELAARTAGVIKEPEVSSDEEDAIVIELRYYKDDIKEMI